MRKAAGILGIVAVLLLPDAAAAQTPDGRISPVPASFQVDLAAPGPQVFTASLPADATGTVQFLIDDNPVGGPVPVVAGTARSDPVTIPRRQSITVRMDYSGDERYRPVSAVTIADYRPEETPDVAGQPEPAAPAPAAPARQKRPRTLPRTGGGTAWTASAGVVLILAGLAAGRRRRLGGLFPGR